MKKWTDKQIKRLKELGWQENGALFTKNNRTLSIEEEEYNLSILDNSEYCSISSSVLSSLINIIKAPPDVYFISESCLNMCEYEKVG